MLLGAVLLNVGRLEPWLRAVASRVTVVATWPAATDWLTVALVAAGLALIAIGLGRRAGSRGPAAVVPRDRLDWPRRAAWAPLVAGAAGALAMALIWLLLVRTVLGDPDSTAAMRADGDLLRTLVQLAGGLLLVAGFFFGVRALWLSRDRQVTDRYAGAVARLGERDLNVRLGAIYALERIARESTGDHWPVIEVLQAFVSEHAPLVSAADPSAPTAANRGATAGEYVPPAVAAAHPPARVPADVQAALTVIGRRNRRQDRDGARLSLRSTDLRRADLRAAGLRRADLSHADLSNATLVGADLGVAGLVRANLTRADLSEANLHAADLTGADLSRADLSRADLTAAHLTEANLSGANLSRANLGGAHLAWAQISEADLIGARLVRAYLTEADLTWSNLSEADLTEADLTKANLRQVNLRGATLHGADLRGADLSGANLKAVRDLSEAALIQAISWASATLPPHLAHYEYARPETSEP